MKIDTTVLSTDNLPPYQDPGVTHLNTEPNRATFTPYASVKNALDDQGRSSRVLNLNGIWKFAFINGKFNVPVGYARQAKGYK